MSEQPPSYQQYGYGFGAGSGAGEFAGFWIRFLAALVDGLIIGIPFAFLNLAINDNFAVSSGIGGFGEAGVVSLLRNVAAALYFAYLEGGPTGQTIGKRLCNIRVVDEANGQPGIGPGRGFLRYLMSLVSGFALAIGYLWMLWDPRNQTWHDKVAHTYVVKV